MEPADFAKREQLSRLRSFHRIGASVNAYTTIYYTNIPIAEQALIFDQPSHGFFYANLTQSCYNPHRGSGQKRQDFSAFMQNVFPVILFGGDTYVRADSCAES